MVNSYQLFAMKTRLHIVIYSSIILFMVSCLPEKDIELRQIKSVVADVTDEPTLKAEVIFLILIRSTAH